MSFVASNFKSFLAEERGEKTKKTKVVFKETDGTSPYPELAISAIKKEITKQANDLEVEIKDIVDFVDNIFEELKVPVPMAYNKERWEQYVEMLKHARERALYARGSLD